MRILIIGGTRFLGRHLAEAAIAQGHELTLFNRGKSNPALFPQVETLVGDRNGGLDVLAGRRWDAVIDTCGYVPRVVRASAEALAASVSQYVFISSISVYAGFAKAGITEEDAVGTLEDESVEEVTGETYGPLKALCEQAVTAAYSDRALIIRPGLIVGPHDVSDRFSYWPYRVARGGEVLAPGSPAAPVQVIDVRDLAEWIIRLVEAGQGGVYHATGPDYPLTMDDVLKACRAVTGSKATFTWVTDDFLVEREIGAYVEMPLWVPADPAWEGFDTVDVSKAIAAGLTFRPLESIIADTFAWLNTRPDDYAWRAGLLPERESELLELWREQR